MLSAAVMELGLKSVDAADGGAGEVEHVAIGARTSTLAYPSAGCHSRRDQPAGAWLVVAPCS